MEVEAVILVLSFFLLLVMDVPVAFAIAIAAFLAAAAIGPTDPQYLVAHTMASKLDSFALLAIPFFILAGALMGEGGMARRLIDFANALVGSLRGGLAYVSTLTCMLFGAISGSAAAAVSSIGGFMIPEMDRSGYDRRFAVAVTTTAATTGLIIPPSNIMIVYTVVASNVTIAAMFMAGILPGILIGLGIMGAAMLVCRRRGYGAARKEQRPPLGDASLRALPSLMLIVIVLGGIFGGVFTATEASAVAVLYAYIVGAWIHGELSHRALPKLVSRAAVTTGVVMLLIGASQAMSWVLAYEQIPQNTSKALLGLTDNPFVLLLIINVTLLIVGTFMDMTPAVLIFTPLFLPVARELGMHPVQFGVIMIANLCIGLCTPPVGTCLFVGCSVGKTRIADVSRQMIPFFIAMVVGLMVITYWEGLTMWLPRVMGLV